MRFSQLLLVFIFLNWSNEEILAKDEQIMPGVFVKEIDTQTFLVTDKEMFWTNILVTLHNDNRVLITSSLYDTERTHNLLKWINKKFRPKKMIAINTHYHADGTGGNEAYHKWKVETWSSDLTAKLLMEQGVKLRRETIQHILSFKNRQRVLKTQLTPAKNTFALKQGKSFRWGDETVQLIFPGHAHSPDNIAVYFPNRKLLFGGCAVKASNSLGYLRDADTKAWSDTMLVLARLEAKTVVPGHGKLVKGSIKNTLNLLLTHHQKKESNFKLNK